MLLETRKITDIKVDNRAREDLGDLEELAQSIKEKGLLQPVTIDDKGNLLAGGRRYAAHVLLEKEEIEVIVRKSKGKIDALEIELFENIHRKDLTWQERARLEKRIYDERSKDGEWSTKAQADLLDESRTTAKRYRLMGEALDLLPELSEHQNFDQAWKEYKKLEENYVADVLVEKVSPKLRHTAKWAEDHYRIGDAFDGMAMADKNSVHFAEVDPPYGVDLHARKSRNKGASDLGEYNEIEDSEYEAFYERAAKEVYRILKDNHFAIFWYGMSWHEEVKNVLKKVGFRIPDIPAVWVKGNSGQTAQPNTTFGSCYEPFFLARKGKPVLAKPGRGNVFDFKPVAVQRKIHPTERPLELMTEIIQTCCQPGSIIMVPFLGSGVTLRAAYRTGHTGFGWDLSERHKVRFLNKVAEDLGKEGEGDDEAEGEEDV